MKRATIGASTGCSCLHQAETELLGPQLQCRRPPCTPAVHDQVNLALIPLIGALTIAGLVGAIDPAITTYAFLAYVLLDSIWLVVQVCAAAEQALHGKGNRTLRVRR